MLIRFLINLLLWLTKSKPSQEQSLNGPLTGDPEGPCGLKEDAFEEAVVRAEEAFLLMQERAMALMLCQMEHMNPLPPPPPGPMQPLIGLQTRVADSDRKTIETCVATMRAMTSRIRQVVRKK
jgi:hypothetical protein